LKKTDALDGASQPRLMQVRLFQYSSTSQADREMQRLGASRDQYVELPFENELQDEGSRQIVSITPQRF
jgi:hypothetical protein